MIIFESSRATTFFYLYQDPREKLDRREIAKLMPVATIKEFSKKCKRGLDEIYLARKASNVSEVGRLFMYEKILNMDIITKPFKTGDQVLRAPTIYNKKYDHHDQNYVAMDEKSANLFYITLS